MVRDPKCRDRIIVLPMQLVEELDLRPRLDSHVIAYHLMVEEENGMKFHDVYSVKGGRRITGLLGEWKEGDEELPSRLFEGKNTFLEGQEGHGFLVKELPQRKSFLCCEALMPKKARPPDVMEQAIGETLDADGSDFYKVSERKTRFPNANPRPASEKLSLRNNPSVL